MNGAHFLLVDFEILLFSLQGSKLDEDYDTYIENLMTQFRQLPPMSVLEPALSRNYAVCSIFGSGDLTKIGMTRDYSTRQGDLKGTFGVAHLAHVSDHYNTQPFGDLPPLPPQPPVSTQRGFYDQEFAALKLENDGECSVQYDVLFTAISVVPPTVCGCEQCLFDLISLLFNCPQQDYTTQNEDEK